MSFKIKLRSWTWFKGLWNINRHGHTQSSCSLRILLWSVLLLSRHQSVAIMYWTWSGERSWDFSILSPLSQSRLFFFPCSLLFFDKRFSRNNESFIAEMFLASLRVCWWILAYKTVCLFFYLRLLILLVHCQKMKMERKLSKWQLIIYRLCVHRYDFFN